MAKVILLTARTQPQDKKLGLAVGADDHVTKPFDHAELLKKIKEHVK